MSGVTLALLIGILGATLALLGLIALVALALLWPLISQYAIQGERIEMRDTLYCDFAKICDETSAPAIAAFAIQVS